MSNDSKELTIRATAEIVNKIILSYNKNEVVNLTKLKNEVSKKFKLKNMPKLIDIIASLPETYRDKLTPYLKAKPVRTASGIAVVAVMCKPHRCPHIAVTGKSLSLFLYS